MANPWKARVLAFNRRRQEEGEKAGDMDVLITAMMKLPPGQLKKLLSDVTDDIGLTNLPRAVDKPSHSN